jgi:nitroreductase
VASLYVDNVSLLFNKGGMLMPNQIIETMLNHKSIRKYKSQALEDDIIKTIVRAAQQAPFASQLYSVILSRKGKNPFGAPLLFTICMDMHRMELIMKKRNWDMITNDLSLLLFAAQDASLMAENMIIAGESLGLGSCLLGAAPYRAEKIKEDYKLPDKVFPLVQLVMGYPDEDSPTRPRYPMEFVLFEEEYPEITDEMLKEAMDEMDEGYINQNYYRKMNAKIHLENGKEETYDFDNYGWTEHISRKWGQWYESPDDILEQLKKCGFDLTWKQCGTPSK